MKLTEIESIPSQYVDRLEAVGLDSIEAYLSACRSVAGRQALAQRTAISENLLLGWAERAELNSLSELPEEFGDLLEAAAIGGLSQLAEYAAAELLEELERCNEAEQIVIELPELSQVQDWIVQAKRLPRLLEY